VSAAIFRNEKGQLCALCDGWHRHEHVLPDGAPEPATKETTMKTESAETPKTTAPAKFTLMLFNTDSYGSRGKTLGFASEPDARNWAEKYLEAFPHHAIFLVEGKAEALTPVKTES
jgi:hypothetical protein